MKKKKKKEKKKRRIGFSPSLPPSLLFLCSAVFQTSNSVTKSHQRQHKFVSKVSRSTSNHTKSYKTLSLSHIKIHWTQIFIDWVQQTQQKDSINTIFLVKRQPLIPTKIGCAGEKKTIFNIMQKKTGLNIILKPLYSLSLISRFIGHKYLLIGCKKPNKRIQSIQSFLLKGNR